MGSTNVLTGIASTLTRIFLCCKSFAMNAQVLSFIKGDQQPAMSRNAPLGNA